MDSDQLVLDDVSSKPDSDSVRPRAAGIELEKIVVFRPESLTELGEVIEKYRALGLPEPHNAAFAVALLQRPDAWFVRLDTFGLAWLTMVVPNWSATFDFAFWDARLHNSRRAALKTVIQTSFDKFNLIRLNAYIPGRSNPLKDMYRKLGFVYEGTVRKAWPVDPPDDMRIYGMLKEEIPWQSPKMISSD